MSDDPVAEALRMATDLADHRDVVLREGDVAERLRAQVTRPPVNPLGLRLLLDWAADEIDRLRSLIPPVTEAAESRTTIASASAEAHDDSGHGPVGPAGKSLPSDVPVHRADDASGTTDLEMSGAELFAEHRGIPEYDQCAGSGVLVGERGGARIKQVICEGCGQLVGTYPDAGNDRKVIHNRPLRATPPDAETAADIDAYYARHAANHTDSGD